MNAHEEYIQIRQGKHPAYRWGSDRIANANSFVFRNPEAMLDFTSNGEFHPDTDEAIRNEAKERCEAKQRLNTQHFDEVKRLSLQFLTDPHVQDNLHRLGTLGAENVRMAISLLKEQP